MKPAMKTKPQRSKYRNFLDGDDEDPMSGVVNLFDVAMVFAAVLLFALLNSSNVKDLFTEEDYMIIKNPGKNNMEILNKEGVKLEKYQMSDENMAGEGSRLGVCYKLENGEVVYVPEEGI